MALVDSYGRRINYLRLSITDRCNLRCCYCMPQEGVAKLPPEDMLSYEDLHLIAREAVALGIEKIRLTGGEPLVRKGLVDFVERLSRLPGLKELVLTTNGLLLRHMAQELRRAGVQRLNISLDSLHPETYAAITRGGDVGTVMDGIAAAEDAGFPPPKINMVVMRGINDGEVTDFAALTLEKGYTVRFIEYMPTKGGSQPDTLWISGREVLERISRRFPLMPVASPATGGPEKTFRIQGAAGALGIITPVSGHFCDSCNRIRVTASGMARGCLFFDKGADLKHSLRSNDMAGFRLLLEQLVTDKPGRHQLGEKHRGHAEFAMSQIGG